jgi:DNA-binding IscR family transcriptional regulator
MFMAANSLFAGAAQILCYLAYVGGEGANAERLAGSLKTNPVVVRRILKMLADGDLVTIRQGRHGGVSLKRSPDDISLQDIYEAVGEGGLFAFRERGNPRCPVNRAMSRLLAPVFAAADQAVAQSLAQTRLSALVEAIG